jgi:beta-1,4-mannosyltransferase
VEVVTSAQLVVLPYREMHNSGTALTALSLDRPVLVPDNEVTRRLAHEVGDAWVHHFRGDLDARDIETALDEAAALGDSDRPDLSLREWDRAGADHVRAYRRAVALLRGSDPGARIP